MKAIGNNNDQTLGSGSEFDPISGNNVIIEPNSAFNIITTVQTKKDDRPMITRVDSIGSLNNDIDVRSFT